MPRIIGRHARAGAVASVLVVALLTSPARAEDKRACANAYVQAQVQRQKGHLKASRSLLLACASECSADLRADCATWLREVEAALPSIVIEAVGPDGRETADVRVTCDGVELLAKLDGRAVPMDPGPHTCRAEMQGEPPKEEQLLVPEGEQHRPWRVSFKHAPTPQRVPEKPRPAPPPPPARPGPDAPFPVPLPVLVVGGIGAVAAIVGTVIEVSGLSQHGALDRCKPNCTTSAVDSDRTTFAVGDVTLGIAVASLATAAVLYLTRSASPEATSKSMGLYVDARRDGGALGLEGRF
jgi:hypothetical protein